MMTGLVTAGREAVIRLPVRGTRGREVRAEAVIDTGFNGFLTLPARLIADLALPFATATRAVLGDGSRVDVDVFEGIVLWDNRERDVAVLAAEGGVLVGMSMLSGYRLTLDVEDGGSVLVEALP
jgi:clan AA aspartic protease